VQNVTKCLLVVALKMGELSTVESLQQHVGTAALGCPAERSSAVLKCSRGWKSNGPLNLLNCRSIPDWEIMARAKNRRASLTR
jgi:hypothetical protein